MNTNEHEPITERELAEWRAGDSTFDTPRLNSIAMRHVIGSETGTPIVELAEWERDGLIEKIRNLQAALPRLIDEVEAGRREIAFYAEKHDSMARSIVTLADQLREAQGEVATWRAAEHDLSDAYLRIRKLLSAWDTSIAPSSEQVWGHTEAVLTEKLAELTALRDENEWRNIESAPRRKLILITNPRWDEPVRSESLKEGPLNWAKGYAPTHWRPLPAPPLTTTTTETEGK